MKNGEIPIYTEVLCKNRDKFINYMAKNRIEIRKSLPSIHRASYISKKKFFKNSNKFETDGVFLPCGPDQRLNDIIKVIKKINKYLLKKN